MANLTVISSKMMCLSDRKLLFILLILLSCSRLHAQNVNLPKVVPASPEATAIAKYINYPVNYSTGLPNINIPLYEIKVGNLTLPISLSYHASGLKVNDGSGWVGTSWSLQAEPMISRSVKGSPDESGYIINNSTGYPSYPNDGGVMYNISMANGPREEEPDEFYYTLLTKSGGFYFKHRPRSTDPVEIISHPYEPIKITHNPWQIIDDNGTIYKFGAVTNSVEYGGSYSTAWKASEIISAVTGDIISFQYHPSDNESLSNFSDMIVVQDEIPDVQYPTLQDIRGADGKEYFIKKDEYGNTFLEFNRDFSAGAPMSTVSMGRIKEITFTNGKVTFEKTAGNLSAIKVYNDDGLIKQFKFYQNPYPVVSGAPPKTRLDLIEILDANGNVIEKYSFNYNSQTLPSRNSRNDQDYWGFCSFGSVQSLVPAATISVSGGANFGTGNVSFGMNRYGVLSDNPPPDQSLTSGLQAGILTRITYPTGGYTEFEYESNKYIGFTETGGNKYAWGGGLRILKIRDYDPVANKKIVRTFKYGENENGGGFLKRKLTSDDHMVDQRRYEVGSSSGVRHWRKRTYYGHALTDLFYSAGPPVVYNEVAEYKINENTGENLGKTIYKYNYVNAWHSTSNKLPGSTIVADYDEDWKRGQLMVKEDYQKNGNGGYDLISHVRYKYQEFASNTIPVGKVFRRRDLLIEPSYPQPEQFEDIQYYPYSINTGAMRVLTDTMVYVGGYSMLTAKTYSYGNSLHLYPTQIQTTSSDGKAITETMKYPHDLSLTGSAESARQNLISNWRINEVLEQSHTKALAVTRTKTEYNIFYGRAFPELIKTNTAPGNADEIRMRYGGYDTRGNILTVSKENDISVSYIWGYKQQYPVAEVKNAAADQIAFTSFEKPDENGGWTYTHNSSSDARTGILSFNGSVVSKSGLPNGNYVVAFWAKRKNGVNGSVSGSVSTTIDTDSWKYYTFKLPNVSGITLNLSNALIDELRAHPAGAYMTSYTHKPLVGMTSATSPTGISTFYEYDAIGRLSLIRDNDKAVIKRMTYHYKQ